MHIHNLMCFNFFLISIYSVYSELVRRRHFQLGLHWNLLNQKKKKRIKLYIYFIKNANFRWS